MITVEKGVVVAIQKLGQDQAVVGGQALSETLKGVEREGWRVDRELPPFRIEGRYTTPLVREV